MRGCNIVDELARSVSFGLKYGQTMWQVGLINSLYEPLEFQILYISQFSWLLLAVLVSLAVGASTKAVTSEIITALDFFEI